MNTTKYPFALNMKPLPSGVLFYPCSGLDLATPIRLFADWVKDFWFVDPIYLCENRGGRRETHEVGSSFCGFTVVNVTEWVPTQTVRDDKEHRMPWIDPLVRTEVLRRRKDGRTIHVNIRRGYGHACLEKRDFDTISVFFYRGDSQGEGGSNEWWLCDRDRNLFGNVMERMPSGGLVVTDGSNCRGSKEIRLLAQLHNHCEEKEPPVKEFIFRKWRKFTYIGQAGMRYGPTLIWQVEDLPGVQSNPGNPGSGRLW